MTDELITNISKYRYSAIDPNKIHYDIICNGFNMRAVIIDVLRENLSRVDNEHNDKIAEAIKEAFAIKMGLKEE
jgi:hypothetical protein